MGKVEPIKMLVFGHPGTEKTRLIGTEPSTLIFRPPTDHTTSIPAGTCDEWVIQDHNDLTEAIDYWRMEGCKKYKWGWLDTISQMQDYGLDHIWADTLARQPHRNKLGAGGGLDKPEYGSNMYRLAAWCRHMINGSGQANFGITAHPWDGEDEDGDPMVYPWIQGKKMPQTICGYMNIVGYMRHEVIKGKRVPVLITDPTARRTKYDNAPKFYVKDQFNALGGRMINPTMPKIEAAIAAQRRSRPRPTRRPLKSRASRRV